MKSVGKIVLTIYVTIATLAAAFFGYFYFKRPAAEEVDGGISGSKFGSILTTLKADFNTLAQDLGISGYAATFDSEAKNSYGLSASDYTENLDSGYFEYIYSAILPMFGFDQISTAIANEKNLNGKYNFTINIPAVEHSAAQTISCSVAFDQDGQVLNMYIKYSNTTAWNDGGTVTWTGGYIVQLILNKDFDNYTEMMLWADEGKGVKTSATGEKEDFMGYFGGTVCFKVLKGTSNITNFTQFGKTPAPSITDYDIVRYKQNNGANCVCTIDQASEKYETISEKLNLQLNIDYADSASTIVEQTIKKYAE